MPGLNDDESLVQLSSERTQMIDDIYLTPAETVEDLMFWAVMHKSMKKTRPVHAHVLQIRSGSELIKRAHAIRMAVGAGYWNARVEVFNPEKLNVNLATADISNWQQLSAFQYPAENCKRVVHLDPDMLVFKNIDDMTHKYQSLILARDMGDCRNFTAAMHSEKPATMLYSMVPQPGNGIVNLLTSKEVQLTATRADGLPMGPLNNASMLMLAYKRAHPELPQGKFSHEEFLPASCLVHHKDKALQSRGGLDMKVLYLGQDGKEIIRDVIAHGKKRLQTTLYGLKAAGRHTLANAIETWFQLFDSEDVKAILDAARNGELAES